MSQHSPFPFTAICQAVTDISHSPLMLNNKYPLRHDIYNTIQTSSTRFLNNLCFLIQTQRKVHRMCGSSPIHALSCSLPTQDQFHHRKKLILMARENRKYAGCTLNHTDWTCVKPWLDHNLPLACHSSTLLCYIAVLFIPSVLNESQKTASNENCSDISAVCNTTTQCPFHIFLNSSLKNCLNSSLKKGTVLLCLNADVPSTQIEPFLVRTGSH